MAKLIMNLLSSSTKLCFESTGPFKFTQSDKNGNIVEQLDDLNGKIIMSFGNESADELNPETKDKTD
jgi:hypothetical protein